MAHLIDKSALVAEIQKLDALYHTSKDISGELLIEGLFQFFKNCEVKEVDLEKHLKEDIEDVFFDLDGVAVKGATHYLTVEDIKDLAKHFFELGLKAQKGKEVDLEKDVRQIISLYYEGIKYYEDAIRKEREENGGSDLAIKIMDGVVDARELSIQYVIDKLKAQKGE